MTPAPVIREEDKLKSYYKYYEAGIAPIAQEDIDFANGEGMRKMGEGLEFADRNLLLSPESHPAAPGVYPLKAGGYLVASNIPTPDITGDMMRWWTAWHSLDSFRYIMWDPDDHYGIELSDEDRARVLDPNVPLMEKTWGTTQIVSEKMLDEPPETLKLHICDPATMGFDVSLIGTPACRYLSVARAEVGPVHVVVAATLAETPEGNEFRERFWVGYDYENGVETCMFPAGVDIPPVAEAQKGTLLHTRKEYRNLNKILPKLYAEEKDRW
ncbi:MAG: hypothetical protein IJO41_04340 [Oscillospiraceae bacterium]|nr:hypothetical protein [Oscillospiraceae bacterium]